MTAKYLKEIGLEIDVDAVANIMAAHNETVSKQNNMAKNAFDAIVSYIARNPMKKGYREEKDKNNKADKYIIEAGLMENILTEANFMDFKVTINEMDKAKYIIRQGKKQSKRSRLCINGKLCTCYQVDLSSLYEEIEEESDTDLETEDDETIIFEEEE